MELVFISNGWKVETEVLQENLGFQVRCERKGLFFLIFFHCLATWNKFWHTTKWFKTY